MPKHNWKSDPETMKLGQNFGPYVHWWEQKERPFFPDRPEVAPDRPKDALQTIRLRSRERLNSKSAPSLRDTFYNSGQAVPLPAEFANPSGDHDAWTYAQIAGRLPHKDDITDDTVITGILDTGIALNQMMSNIAPQRTRVIASWQQGAPFRPVDDKQSVESWLPCGREVFADEINNALSTFGNDEGVVDEDAFNRHLSLSTPNYLYGNRDLEMAFAHGTHTLNLAGGLDAWASEAEERQRHRIIAVNLPAQYSHGSGGNFLAYFAVYGVERILFLADALWEKRKLDPKKTGMVGFPVVINFSYGMVAGPKDGHGTFEAELRRIIENRKEAHWEKYKVAASPVRVFMPAGNDNLERGAATSLLGAEDATHYLDHYTRKQEIDLPWQIKPSDSTANFLEIWTEALPKSVLEDVFTERRRGDLKISVTPPGATAKELGSLTDNTYQDLGDYARVYCRHVRSPQPNGTEEEERLGLLVCVAPTVTDSDGAPVAPAGMWNVRVDYSGDIAIEFEFYIQSDQSAVVTSKTGLRSYFDHANYRTHMTEHMRQFDQIKSMRHLVQDGRIADTFAMPVGGTGRNALGEEVDLAGKQIDNDYWPDFGPVQRRGMANALVSLSIDEIIAVGSYDDGNGAAASYSSSTSGNVGRGNRPGNMGRKDISICFPGENSPSLFGLLSAGSRDGSVVASRGTSMATGLATRTAAMAFAQSSIVDLSEIATETWFRNQAKSFAKSTNWPELGRWSYLKMGGGRMPDPIASTKLSRL